MARVWVDPEQIANSSGLGASQINSWRERGFALVDGLLPQELIEAIASEAGAAYPPAGSAEAEAYRDFGSEGRMAFPSECEAFNELTLHPSLLAAVTALLGVGVRDIRLTQSDLWPKYGHARRGGNDDQRIHVDYPNHTLVHPPRWDAPEAVELILYLSDVDDCGGATAVVPREGADDPAYRWPIVDTPGVGRFDWVNDRRRAEAHVANRSPETARFRAEHLYAREQLARFSRGTVLLYRHDTWHRGTPLYEGTRRIAWNMTFRLAASEWINVLQPGWAWAMYRRSQVMERLIATASVDQRCVLGFPAPGHAYWNHDTVAAVEARFGPLGFDASPYRAGVDD